MKKRAMIILGVLLSSLFVFTGAKSTENGRVTYMEGKAFLVKKNNGLKTLKIQSKVNVGSTIKTDPSSLLEITFGNGHIIRISENAEVVLTSFEGNASLEVKKGKLWSNVQKLAKGEQYQVKSKYGTASVRGTIFNVVAQDSSTRVALYEGKVGVLPIRELNEAENGWGPPGEISGPKEVDEATWILLDPGQMVDLNWDGTYTQQEMEPGQDKWEKFNQKRDAKVQRVHQVH